MIETLKELISKFHPDTKKLHLDQIIVESGRLESILEESTTNEEVVAFESEGVEYMLILRKPCFEYLIES